MASTPVTKKVEGIWYWSSIFRMRGVPLSAPKSEAESVVGEVVPSRSSGASVSSSKLRQTATRAPFGHDFGVSFRPTRARSTVWRSCSSLHFVPGWLPPCCAAALIARAAATKTLMDGSISRLGVRSYAGLDFEYPCSNWSLL